MTKLADRLYLPVVVAVLILGALQSLLRVVAPDVSMFSVLDDAALAVAGLLLLIARRGRVPWPLWAGAGAWMVLVLIAASRSDIATSGTAEVARQLVVPAALILVGAALKRREWIVVAWFAVGIGAANALYAVVEILFGQLIDPSNMAKQGDRTPDGIPASYFWYDDMGERHLRAGGLVLNAPIAGIVIATAIVLACYLSRRWWGAVLALSMLFPLYLTNSRAGFLIVAGGLFIPIVLRYAGVFLTLVLSIIAGSAAIWYFSGHGNSLSHVWGLFKSVALLGDYPLGRGIGHWGNVAVRYGASVAGGESLIGISLSAIGVPAAILILLLIACSLIRYAEGKASSILVFLGLSTVAAALLSESLSALNGTLPLWAAVGIVFGHTIRADNPHWWPRHKLWAQTGRAKLRNSNENLSKQSADAL